MPSSKKPYSAVDFLKPNTPCKIFMNIFIKRIFKMAVHTGICFLLPYHIHKKIIANWPFAESFYHTSHLGLWGWKCIAWIWTNKWFVINNQVFYKVKSLDFIDIFALIGRNFLSGLLWYFYLSFSSTVAFWLKWAFVMQGSRPMKAKCTNDFVCLEWVYLIFNCFTVLDN